MTRSTARRLARRPLLALLAAALLAGAATPAFAHPRHHHRLSWSVGIGFGAYHPFRHLYLYPRLYAPYWGYPLYTDVYVPGYPPVWSGDLGAVDLNVKPKAAEVYLDGSYLGHAREFDGYPRYLWLEPGTYQLALYREGFRTEVRTVEVRRGLVIDFRLRLAEGEAVRPQPPERQASAPPVRREESPPAVRDEAWRQRSAPPAPVTSADPGASIDARGEPGYLILAVAPADGSVYLDGRFLGSGSELASGTVAVDPGSHVLEVVRPGYDARKVPFEVVSGEEVTLTVDLAAATESPV